MPLPRTNLADFRYDDLPAEERARWARKKQYYDELDRVLAQCVHPSGRTRYVWRFRDFLLRYRDQHRWFGSIIAVDDDYNLQVVIHRAVLGRERLWHLQPGCLAWCCSRGVDPHCFRVTYEPALEEGWFEN